MKRQPPHHGWRFVFCFTLLLSACLTQPTPEPTPTTGAPLVVRREENPYAPKPEDLSMQQAGVILTSLDLSEVVNVTPLRTQLTILGSMPSVCNELRIKINPPDDAYQVFIEIYSLVNPDVKCENVLQQFEASILLGIYSSGRYTVLINGGLVGDFVVY